MTHISRTNLTIQKSLFLCLALAIAISVGCDSSPPPPPTPEIAKSLSSPEIAKTNDDNQIRCSTMAPPLDQRLAIET
jgi:hypothetical protein